MRTCTYRSVLDRIAALAGIETIDRVTFGLWGAMIRRRTREAWRKFWWTELMRTETRRYRNTYASGTTYAAPTATSASEIYYPPTRQYYQALRSSTGNAPATLSGGVYSTNTEYWAVAAGPYSGNDWADATAYVRGDVVRNPANDRFYQCYTAHTSSGSIDTAKFGILTVFDPYISRTQSWETNEVGEWEGLYLDDPRVTRNPRRVAFTVDATGAHVLPLADTVPHEVWARFRLPPSGYTGADFDATDTYTAGETMYYASPAGTVGFEGDFWECVSTTSAGNDPEDTPAKWSRIEFPEVLQEAVAHLVYADHLRAEELGEDALIADRLGDDILAGEFISDQAQQGQFTQWRMSA